MKKVAVYLLLGPDIVSKKEYMNKILAAYSISDEIDNPQRCVFFAAESSTDDIIAECETYPFFGGNKGVVVYEAEKLAVAKLKSYIENCIDTTVLILMSDKNKGKFSSVIEKAVAARGEVVMFWNMFEDKLELWTERKARAEYNISFPTGFGSFMVEQCGQNSLLLEKDLQVLANYFGEKSFSLQEAASVIHEQKEITVFTLVKDFYTGNLQNALLNFRRLLFEGEAPVYMLIMLQRQLELIWQYKTGQGKVRLGKLAMQELASQARLWSFAQLASLYRNLFAVEKSLKSDGKEARRLFFEKAIMDGCRLLAKRKKL